MKYKIRRFKSLKDALNELAPYVRDGEHLQTGRPFLQLGGMRSREALGNWLICVAANFEYGSDRLSFTSDPTGGDGVICDSKTDETWQTEHIVVPRPPPGVEAAEVDTDAGILDAVSRKVSKGGSAYASDKILVVFINVKGSCWRPNNVAKKLPTPLHFSDVWVTALQCTDQGKYIYAVTQLVSDEKAFSPTWIIRIAADFDSWTVRRLQ